MESKSLFHLLFAFLKNFSFISGMGDCIIICDINVMSLNSIMVEICERVEKEIDNNNCSKREYNQILKRQLIVL